MTRLVSIDPYTEAINGEYEAFSFDQCTAAVDRARRHLPEWQNLPVAERAGLLKGLITVLEGKKHHFARVIPFSCASITGGIPTTSFETRSLRRRR